MCEGATGVSVEVGEELGLSIAFGVLSGFGGLAAPERISSF